MQWEHKLPNQEQIIDYIHNIAIPFTTETTSNNYTLCFYIIDIIEDCLWILQGIIELTNCHYHHSTSFAAFSIT